MCMQLFETAGVHAFPSLSTGYSALNIALDKSGRRFPRFDFSGAGGTYLS